MIRAWLHIRRQLRETPGMLRYTTGISSLREFFTCTLWDTELEMFAFMSSGAHREMMWNFRRWSDSFWAMRWDQTQDELGYWEDARASVQGRFAPRANVSRNAALRSSTTRNHVAEWLSIHGLSVEPQEDASRVAASGTTAVIARIPSTSLVSIGRLRTLLRPWRTKNPDLLRFTLAIGIGEALVIAVWKIGALEESRALMVAISHACPDAWAMRFTGHDYEVGSWDNLRLGEIRLSADRTVAEYIEHSRSS